MVHLEGLTEGTYTLKIMNTIGQAIFSRNIRLNTQAFTELLELPGLTKGYYYLVVTGPNILLNHPFTF